eukprot:jgi/Orpsp1_1/1189885/evm.model.d7180000075203.1
MKLFFFLVNIFSILGLILAQNSTTIDEECQVYYSLIGSNDGSCCIPNDNRIPPYSICKNGHITNIMLYNCKIKEINSSIMKLTELEELILTGNEITVLPDEFYNLKKLKTLHLNHKIKKISPLISQLTELEELNISSIKGEVPNEIFSLKKMKK